MSKYEPHVKMSHITRDGVREEFEGATWYKKEYWEPHLEDIKEDGQDVPPESSLVPKELFDNLVGGDYVRPPVMPSPRLSELEQPAFVNPDGCMWCGKLAHARQVPAPMPVSMPCCDDRECYAKHCKYHATLFQEIQAERSVGVTSRHYRSRELAINDLVAADAKKLGFAAQSTV